MDIEINITPRLIERAVFIILIIILLVSNFYFYNKSKSPETTEEISSELTETKENKTSKAATTTTSTTPTTIPASNETGNKTEFTASAAPPPGRNDCVKGWKCYKPYYKAFLTEDCKWINVQNCINGCEDGKCKE